MKSIIVAYEYKDRIIGSNGRMPWEGMLPADLAHFKAETLGTSIIMGRKTLDSLGRALPGRQNIAISRSPQEPMEDVTFVGSLEEAYEAAEHDIFVIGGQQIYELALPTVTRVVATEIIARFHHGDAFFPELPPDEWKLTEQRYNGPYGKNRFPHGFLTYERRNPVEE